MNYKLKQLIQLITCQKPNPNLIFIWIPKTAGSSVFKSFREILQMQIILSIDELNENFVNSRSVTFGHMSIQNLLEEKLISNDYFENSKKLAVIRNPYDRFISLFHYLREQQRIPPVWDYHDFISAIIDGIPDVGLYNSKGLSQANQQVKWIKDVNLDCLVRYENLKNQLNIFSKKYYKTKIMLSHENRSFDRMRFESKLNTKTIDKINEFYLIDFVEFDYPMIK